MPSNNEDKNWANAAMSATLARIPGGSAAEVASHRRLPPRGDSAVTETQGLKPVSQILQHIVSLGRSQWCC